MVQSVRRAAQVLRELAHGRRPMGVTELAGKLEVAKPTAHALLRTLADEGLVAQDAESGRYALGPELLHLGNSYLDGHELRARSITWANALAAEAGEAVWVGALLGDAVLILHHAFRPSGAVQVLEVGARIPWNTCALGKAIVAFLSPGEEKALLEGERAVLTGQSITDPAVLEEQLSVVRGTGYAVEDQESALGDAGLAAPVFDRAGLVVGAIGVVGAVERVAAAHRRDEFAAAVREAARNLSRDLGAPRGASWRASAEA
jgi:DNA-binding IclR family transcriptional regulator